MKWLIPVLLVVASLTVVGEAQAFHFGRRAVVVQAGGANVFVGGGGAFRRQSVVVQAQPVFVQRSFVQPVFVQPFAVQSFNGGCQSFFVR